MAYVALAERTCDLNRGLIAEVMIHGLGHLFYVVRSPDSTSIAHEFFSGLCTLLHLLCEAIKRQGLERSAFRGGNRLTHPESCDRVCIEMNRSSGAVLRLCHVYRGAASQPHSNESTECRRLRLVVNSAHRDDLRWLSVGHGIWFVHLRKPRPSSTMQL